MGWNERLLNALRAHGLVVRDFRLVLPRHATRTYDQRDPADLRGLVWHQALSYGYGQRTVEAIAKYHVGPRSHLCPGGAPGFAYTLAVDGDGTVYLCQPVELATWSHGQKLVPDANSALIGVCALGHYAWTGSDGKLNPADTPPPPQEAALVRVWLACRAVWGWAVDGANGGLLGHEDLGKPSCPGDRLEAVKDALRAGQPPPPLVDSTTLTGRAQVAYRQGCLAALGYALGLAGIDGEDGPTTHEAVRVFQGDYGLVVDGKWGARTEAKMQELMLSRYPLVAPR